MKGIKQILFGFMFILIGIGFGVAGLRSDG